MTTVNEVDNDETKVPDEFLFRSLFRLFVLHVLPNSMRKLIHNRCKLTCKLIREIKHDVTSNGKNETFASVFSCLYSRVKNFLFAVNSRRHLSTSV